LTQFTLFTKQPSKWGAYFFLSDLLYFSILLSLATTLLSNQILSGTSPSNSILNAVGSFFHNHHY
jgi:hypothetical protein